jgi:hypothetical protein
MPPLLLPSQLSRRIVCAALFGLAMAPVSLPAASSEVLVHKDPNCGCCGAWAKHLEAAGFAVTIKETSDRSKIRHHLGIPADLGACHTAEIGGYAVEGHVPATAIRRLIEERPDAAGIAVAGMPAGSPGMGGKPERYSVVLFGPGGRRTYMQFVGLEAVG